MSIPLLNYSYTTQNQRVEGYEVPNEDTPTMYRLAAATSDTDIDAIIWAAYRQIFSEHLIIAKSFWNLNCGIRQLTSAILSGDWVNRKFTAHK
jgi:hypothetical protein